MIDAKRKLHRFRTPTAAVSAGVVLSSLLWCALASAQAPLASPRPWLVGQATTVALAPKALPAAATAVPAAAMRKQAPHQATCAGAVSASYSGAALPLSAAEQCGLKPRDVFKECTHCPEMTVVPAGAFTMGSPEDEPARNKNEGPRHKVTFAQPFAVARYPVTFEEWDACVAAGGCGGYSPSDQSWGRGRRPVIHVSWDDAQAYVAWLSRTTGKPYRLLTEAEREYVTRAGTSTPFWFGKSITPENANFDDKHPYGNGPAGGTRGKTLPVDSFAPNPWGLYQVHGNVWDWVEDCFHDSYVGAPTDGSAWTAGTCDKRVSRGGGWLDQPRFLRSAFRLGDVALRRYDFQGFRVARNLGP